MASRAVVGTYYGMACPMSATIPKAHGAASPIAEATFNVDVSVPVPSPIMIMIGGASFYGTIVETNVKKDVRSGTKTSLQAVDWRDRLHDKHIYGAFNVQENDGRTWHMLPDDWDVQLKTWVSQELDQIDLGRFQRVEADANLLRVRAGQGLLSASSILNKIADEAGFRWQAVGIAEEILDNNYPNNINWMSGVTYASAITSVLDQYGMQFTVYGSDVVYISLRGFSNNAVATAFLNGLDNFCVFGAHEGSAGYEINDKGRRAVVVGDRNRYQFIHPCKPDWNPRWTWQLCFGTWQLTALLRKLGLTRENKLSDMPAAYQDESLWLENAIEPGDGAVPNRRKRNDMKIKEYIEKICWKTYVVDFEHIVFKPKFAKKDAYEGRVYKVDRDTLEVGKYVKTLKAYNETAHVGAADIERRALWPISDRLPTESNAREIICATSMEILNGIDKPFNDQTTCTPMTDGVSMEVQEIINKKENYTDYKVLIKFNQPQVFLVPGLDWTDPRSVRPDTPLAILSQDREIYIVKKGDNENTVRVREQKRSVKGLHKAHYMGKEIKILAENYAQDMKDGGARPATSPVKADDIGERIADQMLFHNFTDRSGHLMFRHVAGFEPDGIIASVEIRFDAKTGISENVNFTSEWIRGVDIRLADIRLSAKLKFEGDLARERLEALARAADKSARLAKRAKLTMDSGWHKPGALMGPAATMKAFGGGAAAPGIIRVKAPTEVVSTAKKKKHSIIVVGTYKAT